MPDKTAFARILPVVVALAPIGFLFGVLAGQADWSAWGVLAMALLGFTGSGQFTYLGFAHPDNAQMEYLAVFLIILGI
ncbi:MAG: AzlC family ABC transporter permease, partial [Gammaproteobacteria bacterium]|nr:AzlC family ABC transporter permease [Gammaproteobacteria bacterium]